MLRLLLLIVAIFFALIALISCGESSGSPGEKAVIPASDYIIEFNGGAEGPVIFTHETHSTDYYEGTCLFCHDHEDVAGETQWSCRDCHTAGEDREELCEEKDDDHGCIMTQCQDCHEMEGSPAPDGLSCGEQAGGCHF
jgi:hypothetical protein